jgi:poly(3-hydroxybutyrate) depolymerase
MLETARLAQGAAKASYDHFPRRTYAVGTSNGGYQVRRAMEEAPNLFDGGVDWEGTFIDPDGPNILISLPPASRTSPTT